MAGTRVAQTLVAASVIVGCYSAALAQQDPDCRRQNYTHLENGVPTQGTNGPDVIVGDLIDIDHYGVVNGIHGYAVGTTSCNIGDQNILWIAGNNQHPVIGQSAFRLKNGRMEQIGQSWLKHGFTALTQNVCATCSGQGGTVLGIGCSDPYVASLNGSQGNGPKWDINAASGFYNYPHPGRHVTSGNAIFKRLQIRTTDMAPAGTGEPTVLFFVEGQYVTADDAAADNNENNVSYRRVNCANTGGSPTYNLTLANQTQCTSPAILAWRDFGGGLTPQGNGIADPTVLLTPVDVPGDGRFWVASKVVDNGDGTWSYEYAIQNITSNRSGAQFIMPVSPADVITGIGFHDVEYHSGEKCDNVDWTMNRVGDDVVWACVPNTEPNPVPPPTNWYSNFDSDGTSRKTNALRWGTMYNFRFVSHAAPVAGTASIVLFRPGTPDSIAVATQVPGYAGPRPLDIAISGSTPTYIAPGAGASFDVTISPNDDTVLTADLFYRISSADSFSSVPLVHIDGNNYRADLPPMVCEDEPEYYVAASGTLGSTEFAPPGGAAEAVTSVMGVLDTRFEDNFQTAKEWTVTNTGAINGPLNGMWERAVPLFGNRGDPQADADASGMCYVTGNNFMSGTTLQTNTDVDAGSTTLTSPPMDAFHGQTNLTYWRWFDNVTTNSTVDDTFTVEISNNGSTWVNLETIAVNSPEANGGWYQKSFNVADFVEPTTTVQVRFTASDFAAGSVVEAAVDGVQLTVFHCDNPVVTGACCLADGTCTSGSDTDCSAAGGTFQGVGTSCDSANCPQPEGACCAADGSCTVSSEIACTENGGTYQGNGSSCDSANCPQPTGSCCIDRCTCVVATEADCATQGGVYGGDGSECGSCTPNAACSCDWNGADGLDSQDFFDFLESFFGGDADYNCADGTDSQDYFDYIECFFGGCQ